MSILFWEKILRTSIARYTTSTKNWTVDALRIRLLEKRRHDSRHFHQPFRQLRFTENRTSSAGWTKDLGHCDNLLGHRAVQASERMHQLVQHLRHRCVKKLHHGSNVGELLHGVPLHPCGRGSARASGRSGGGTNAWNAAVWS